MKNQLDGDLLFQRIDEIKEKLKKTDRQFNGRIVDDLIEALVRSRVLELSQLHEINRTVYTHRRALREELQQLLEMQN
jgi:hypothetical protein